MRALSLVRGAAGGVGHELWVGDAGRIRATVVRAQKTNRGDAAHLLKLLEEEERFPRIWVPSREERDVRQLLGHRHKQVQARTRVKNQLHALALSQECSASGSYGRPRGERSWRSCPCCPMRRRGGVIGCTGWRS